MFRPAARQIFRSSISHGSPRLDASRRLLSTAPPHQRSRSWKNSAVRWGLAGTLVYYYTTSNVFADETTYAVHLPPESARETETLPTIEELAAQKRAQRQAEAAAANTSNTSQATSADVAAPGSPEELEEEASQQGAFNEETGEINWDCPCLGGMADGPCGEQFKAAFSCFVYSKEEPKGVDCIDKFKGMQDCFRQHPEIYGAELEDTEGEPGEPQPGDAATPVSNEGQDSEGSSPPSLANIESQSPHGRGEKVSDVKPHLEPDHPDVVQGKQERAEAAKAQVQADHGHPISESKDAVPKAWHDSRDTTSK